MKTTPTHWFSKSFVLWTIGFCLVTFDKVAVISVHDFKVKAAYFFFFASFLLATIPIIFFEGIGVFFRSRARFFRAPWIFWILIIFYAYALAFHSVTRLKSFAYTTWLSFDLICIFGTVQLLRARNAFPWAKFLNVIAGIISLLSVIILIDEVAYYAFGKVDGWIGFNQDTVLKWGVSRPMAFSYEPSYISIFFSVACIFLFTEACLANPKSRYLRKDIAWISLLLGFSALVVTTSRTGWLSTTLGIALASLCALASIKKWYKEVFVFTVVATALILSFVFLIPKGSREKLDANLVHSAMTMHDGSGYSRIKSMLIGLNIGRDTHFLGTGLGASYYYFVLQSNPGLYGAGLSQKEQSAQAVMSTWAELVAELGLAGLLLYAMFAVFTCLSLLRKIEVSPTQWAAFASALVFFIFTAHWLPNISRADVWVWYAVWGIFI